MAAPGAWAPKPDAIAAIVEMLRKGVSGDATLMQQAMTELKTYEDSADFANHLAVVLVQCPPELEGIRATAGATLTGLLRRKAQLYPPEEVAPLKRLLIAGLAAEKEEVRDLCTNGASCLLRVLARKEDFARSGLDEGEAMPATALAWPELLPSLEAGFASGRESAIAGCVRLGSQVIEDSAMWVHAQPGGAFNNVMTRLLQAAEANPARDLRYAIAALTTAASLHPDDIPPIVVAGLPRWVALLSGATRAAPDASVRRAAVMGLTRLAESLPAHMTPAMGGVVELMIAASDDADPDIAAAALDFWPAFLDWVNQAVSATIDDRPGAPAIPHRGKLLEAGHTRYTIPLLPRLVPLLVRRLRITPADATVVSAEDDGGPGPGLAALAAAGTPAAATDSGYALADGTFTETGTVTPRVAASSALMFLAQSLGDPLAEALWPTVSSLLSDTRPENWEPVEAGLRVLDVTLKGCYDWYKSRLGAAIPVICTLATTSRRPVLRATACGVLQRCAPLVASMPAAAVAEVMRVECGAMGDRAAAVQERAVQALVDLIHNLRAAGGLPVEQAVRAAGTAAAMMPHMGERGMRQCCSLFATVVSNVAPAEIAPVVGPIMTSLTAYWASRPSGGTGEHDRGVRYALEAVNSVLVECGPACAPFALPIAERCIAIIENAQIQVGAAREAGEMQPFMACTEWAFEVLGNAVSQAMTDADARAVVGGGKALHAIAWFLDAEEDTDVLESVIGCLVELATKCPAEAMPALVGIWPQLVVYVHFDYGAAAAQALYAISVVLERFRAALTPEMLLAAATRMRDVLVGAHDRTGQGSTCMTHNQLANVALATARLLLVDRSLVMPWIGTPPALTNWISSAVSNDDAAEKLLAAEAIAAAVTMSPEIVRAPSVLASSAALAASFVHCLEENPTAASPDRVRAACAGIMSTIRSQLSDAEWAAESAKVRGKQVRRRANTVTGIAVFPLGDA